MVVSRAVTHDAADSAKPVDADLGHHLVNLLVGGCGTAGMVSKLDRCDSWVRQTEVDSWYEEGVISDTVFKCGESEEERRSEYSMIVISKIKVSWWGGEAWKGGAKLGISVEDKD